MPEETVAAARSWSDLGCSEETFARNRRALAEVRPDLARRLGSPAVHEALAPLEDEDGVLRAHRLFRRRWWRIEETEEDLLGGVELVSGSPEARDQLLVGVGTGERMATLLEQLPPGGRLFAWEPDPGLLVLALSRHDVSASIAAGRLRLLLGGDVQNGATPPLFRALRHPRLAPLTEAAWSRIAADLEASDDRALRPPSRPVAVLRGELLQRELSRALLDRRLGPVEIDLDALPERDLEQEFRRAGAGGVFQINFDPQAALHATRAGLRHVAWEIDPTPEALVPLEAGDPRREGAWIFSWRKARVAALRRAGYRRASWLPIGVDPELRRPPEDATPTSTVVFVGSCMAARADTLERDFLRAVRHLPERRAWMKLLERARSLAGDLLVEPDRRERMDDLVAAHRELALPETLATDRGPADPLMLLGERLAASKRIGVLRQVAEALPDFAVFGERDWERELPSGVWAGQASHGAVLNEIYGRAAVTLDVDRIYQPDIATLRVFETLACGGLPLAESAEDLAELFEPGRELLSWSKVSELVELARHLRSRPRERAALAERGRARVLREHLVRHRVATMLESMDA